MTQHSSRPRHYQHTDILVSIINELQLKSENHDRLCNTKIDFNDFI